MSLSNPTASIALRACELTDISAHLVFSDCRTTRVSQVRFAAWHIARQGGWTLENLAAPFHRDHSAVSHGLVRAQDLLETDPWFRQLIASLSA